MIRRPPRSTLFPYTTLFRSEIGFNAMYLLEILKYMPTDEVRLTFKAPERAATVEPVGWNRSEEHTSELQSQSNLVCRLLLEKKKKKKKKQLLCTKINTT